MYCDFFASGLLFTEITKMIWINLIQCCHNNHWKTWLKVASYCFLKSGGNANICILKSFPWARGSCVHVFLVSCKNDDIYSRRKLKITNLFLFCKHFHKHFFTKFTRFLFFWTSPDAARRMTTILTTLIYTAPSVQAEFTRSGCYVRFRRMRVKFSLKFGISNIL